MTLPVNFDADSAARIYRAVRTVERGDRDQKPLTFDRVLEQGTPRVFKLGRFSGAWATGTDKAITLEGVTSTLLVRNLFFPITAAVSNKSCAVARSNGSWLLLSVPLQTATAMAASGTATTLRITPSQTAAAVAFSSITTANAVVITGTIQTAGFVIGVSAVLDTVTCDIDVTLQSSSINYWGPTNTTSVSVITAGSTASLVTISTAATATAAVIESTQTIQYLRFED